MQAWKKETPKQPKRAAKASKPLPKPSPNPSQKEL